MQPSKTIRRIEKAVYDNGINVALYHVEHSDWYKQFAKDLEDAITSQVKQVVTVNNVDNLSLFLKAKDINVPLLTQITGLMTRLNELINLLDFLIRTGKEGGQAFYDKTGIQGQFLMPNTNVIRYFEGHSKLIINSVDQTTKEWIARKLQEGKSQMKTSAEIVDSILAETDVFSRVRAERIVLTETANAMMVTEIDTAKQYGIKEIIWRTSIDDRVCPTCLPLEGVKTDIGKAFEGGYSHPPAHPSCRCFIEEVLPNDWGF